MSTHLRQMYELCECSIIVDDTRVAATLDAANEGWGFMTKALWSPVETRHSHLENRGFADFDDPSFVDADGNPDFERIQASEDFRLLRRRFLLFVFPMSAAFLCSYMVFVLLSAFAQDFVSTRVFGVVNAGILLGLGQFVTTIIITLSYARYAKRKLDPQVRVVREMAGLKEKSK